MPLKAEIKAVADSLFPPDGYTFIFGTPNETNLKADKATIEKPIICMYPKQPFTSEPSTVNGSVHNEFNIYLQFLRIHSFGEDTDECEALVNEMLLLQNKFLAKLVRYRDPITGGRFFKVSKGTRFNGMPVYNEHDANTCGVTLSIKVQKRTDDDLEIC